MNKIVTGLLLVGFLLGGFLLPAVPAMAMTGSGSEADPYIIYDVTDLQNMANDLNAYYELANDIDASATSGWNGGLGFDPVGTGDIWTGMERATGDHSSSGSWTIYPADGVKWTKVDEPTYDNDTTYIQATADGSRALFTFDAFSIDARAYDIGVIVYIRSKSLGSEVSNIRPSLVVGGNTYDISAGRNIGTIWAWWSGDWADRGPDSETNPKTGLAWTADDINGVGANTLDAFGVYVSDADPNIRVTKVEIYIVYDIPFLGSFDGKGYAIDGLEIHRTSYLGLFGWVGDVGRVSNLGLTNVDISGSSNIGVIAERNYGTISRCYTTGNVTAIWYDIGGFVDDNCGIIEESYSACTVSVTHASSGTGGAGFADFNGGIIRRCYSTGDVLSRRSAAAFVDRNNDPYWLDSNASRGLIEDCYTRSNVTVTQYNPAGFVGDNYGDIRNCYAANVGVGEVGEDQDGGFCNDNQAGVGFITNCFWDMEISSQTTSDGGTGLTTAQMKTKSTYTGVGWDFATVWTMGAKPGGWAAFWLTSIVFLLFAGIMFGATKNPGLSILMAFPLVMVAAWLGVGTTMLQVVLIVVLAVAVIFGIYFVLGRFA